MASGVNGAMDCVVDVSMDALIFRTILFLMMALVPGLQASNIDAYKIIEGLIDDESYDPLVRPAALFGKTTMVELGLYIIDINEFSDVDMDFTMSMYFRQFWTDHRLSSSLLNGTITLHNRVLPKMWYPDTYFEQEKDSYQHVTTVPNVFIGVDAHDGRVFFSQRITTKIACTYDLKRFPFDKQACDFNIMSYGSLKSDMELTWYEQAVQTNPNLKLPEMRLVGTETTNCTAAYLHNVYSCMGVILSFERLTGYYFFNTYIPSVLIVILSWMSFYIDYASVPARISIGLLTVLTITTQNSGIGARLPRVSYIKAIDVWMSTCLVFVFAALIEYSLVNVMARRQKNKENVANAVFAFKRNIQNRASGDGQDAAAEQNDAGASAAAAAAARQPWHRKILKQLQKRYENDHAMIIDVMSRICFPLAFMIFNLVYCIVYLL